MIEAERVDFVSVPTRDASRARRFYGETLGLWQPEADGEPFEPNTAGIALRVADVAAARRELERAGVELLGETVDTGVCHMAFCKDPDGNVLILHRRYAPPAG